MTLGDRPVVQGLFAHDPKQLVCTLTRFRQAGAKVLTDADSAAKSSHTVSPSGSMQLPSEGCTEYGKCRRREGRAQYDGPSRGAKVSIEMNAKAASSSESTI